MVTKAENRVNNAKFYLEGPRERLPEELLLAGDRLGHLQRDDYQITAYGSLESVRNNLPNQEIYRTSLMCLDSSMSMAPPPATIESFFFALE